MALLPPGPKGRLLTGNLQEYRQDRLGHLTRWAREFGDVVRLRFGHIRLYLLAHPDLVEDVLVHRSRLFSKHFVLRMNPVVFGNGLLSSEGDFWLRQRRLIQPAFQRQRLDEYVAAMVACTERLLADWQPGQQRDIHADMMRLTLAIAARVLFGAEAADQAGDVQAALRQLQDCFLVRFAQLLPPPMFLPTPINRRIRRAIDRLDAILYAFIRQRRASPPGASGQGAHDLLSILLHARDEGAQTGMTDQQLRDEMMTLFLAGHETTALVLSWTWYLLARHPAVEARMLEEVRQQLNGRPPTADDLPRLSYLEKIIQEALRLYPPVYTIGREALHDLQIGGYSVPRGTTLLLSQWVLHRDPRFWESPEKFDPDRWSAEQQAQRPRFAYFPFGGGPRICIGNTFALLESVVVLALLAQNYRFTVDRSREVVPTAVFTLRPKPGIFARLESR